jgi:hypothetical protein
MSSLSHCKLFDLRKESQTYQGLFPWYRKFTLIEEPPTHRLLKFRDALLLEPETFWLPMPHLQYLLGHSDALSIASLRRVFMSPTSLSESRWVSSPPLPNHQRDGATCQAPMETVGPSDAASVLTRYWNGVFIKHMVQHNHPVWRHLKGKTTNFSSMSAVFTTWEQHSVDEVLNFPWPQDIEV